MTRGPQAKTAFVNWESGLGNRNTSYAIMFKMGFVVDALLGVLTAIISRKTLKENQTS